MRYYGLIGYAEFAEVRPGVWEDVIVERPYSGDVTRKSVRWQKGENLNDNFDVNNVISVVADPYALEHFGDIRYVTFMNSKWKVSSVEIQPPRLNITIGGIYNGKDEA